MELNFFNLVKNYSADYTRFFSDYSSMQLEITINNNVRIRLTPAINPGDKGRPEKGVARYKQDDQVVFSLSPKECYNIIKNYSDVVSGKYVNTNNGEKDNDKMKNSFTVTHFKENKATKFIVSPSMNTKTGKLSGTAKISISADGKYCTYMLREDEQYIFKEFLKTHATLGSYFYEMRRTIMNSLSSLAYNTLQKEDVGNENNRNQKPQYTNNSNYKKDNYKKSEEVIMDDGFENSKSSTTNESFDEFSEDDIFSSDL